MIPFSRLFFAFLPPVPVAREIGRLRDSAGPPHRPVEDRRLHMTLLMLGDFPALPPGLPARIDAAVDDAPLAACRVALDRRYGGRRSVLLAASEPLRGVRRLQRALVDAIARAGIAPAPYWRFSPHVTLHYDRARHVEGPIDVVSWPARELVLIESRVGRHLHVVRGRWPLRPAAAPASR